MGFKSQLDTYKVTKQLYGGKNSRCGVYLAIDRASKKQFVLKTVDL